MAQGTEEVHVVDGLDVGQLRTAMHDLKEEPDLATLRLRAHNRWIDGAHAETRIYDFYGMGGEGAHKGEFTLTGDEPEPLVGTDKGPNATEALLHGLACCLNASYIYQAALQGIQIDELELEIEGDLDLRGFLGLEPDVPPQFLEIRVSFRVKADVPEGKLKALTDLAQKRSPVFNSVTQPVPVRCSVEVL